MAVDDPHLGIAGRRDAAEALALLVDQYAIDQHRMARRAALQRVALDADHAALQDLDVPVAADVEAIAFDELARSARVTEQIDIADEATVLDGAFLVGLAFAVAAPSGANCPWH